MEFLSYNDVEHEHSVANFMNQILPSENLPEMQIEEQPKAKAPSTHPEVDRVISKIHQKNKSIFKLIKKSEKRKPHKECVESARPQLGLTTGPCLSASKTGSTTGTSGSVSAAQKYSSILNLPKRLHLEEADASIDNNASQHNFDDFDEDVFSLLNSSGFGVKSKENTAAIDLANANLLMALQQQLPQQLSALDNKQSSSSQACQLNEMFSWNQFTKSQQLARETSPVVEVEGNGDLNHGVRYDQVNTDIRSGLIASLLGREGCEQLTDQEQLILLEHLQMVDWQKQVEQVQSAVEAAAVIHALYGGGDLISNDSEKLQQQYQYQQQQQFHQLQQKKPNQQQNEKQQQQQLPGRRCNGLNMQNMGGAGNLANSYSRREKSLEELSKKFLTIFLQKESMMISLDKITQQLDVERRRIYDIINILESLKLVTRRGKNNYKWNGFDQIFTTIESFQSQKDLLGQSSLMENEDENGSMINQSAGIDLNEKKEKSLEILSIGFLKLFLNYKETLSLEEAARKLSQKDCEFQKIKTKIRRLYDIANVFKSLGLIRKVQLNQTKKPAFQWVGICGLQEFYNSSKEGGGGMDDDQDHSLLLGNVERGEEGSCVEGDDNNYDKYEIDCDSGGAVGGEGPFRDEGVVADYDDFQEKVQGQEEDFNQDSYFQNKVASYEKHEDKSQVQVELNRERKTESIKVKAKKDNAEDDENNEIALIQGKSILISQPKKKLSQLFSEECVFSSPRIDAVPFVSSAHLNQLSGQMSNHSNNNQFNTNKILLVSPQLCRKESIDVESVGGIMPLQLSYSHVNSSFMNTPMNRLQSVRKESLEEINERVLTPSSQLFAMGVLSSSKNSAFKRVEKTPSGTCDFGTPQSSSAAAAAAAAAPKCTNVVVIPSPSPRNLFSTPKSKTGIINNCLSEGGENRLLMLDSSNAFSSDKTTAEAAKGFHSSRYPLLFANRSGNSLLTTPKGQLSVPGKATQQRQKQVRSLLFSASASKSSVCKDLSKSFNNSKSLEFNQKDGNSTQDSMQERMMLEVDKSQNVRGGRIEVEEIERACGNNQIEEETVEGVQKRIANEKQEGKELVSQGNELANLNRNHEGLQGFGDDEDQAVFAKLKQASIKMVKKLDFDGEEEESEEEQEEAEQGKNQHDFQCVETRGPNEVTSTFGFEAQVNSQQVKESITSRTPTGKNLVDKLNRKRIQGEIMIGEGRAMQVPRKKSSVTVVESGIAYSQKPKESSAFEHVDLLATMMEVAAHEMRSIALTESLQTNN